VKLFAPDGFTTQATIDEAGGAAAGMFMSVAGVPIDQFAAPAQEFVDQLSAGPLSGKAIDPYAIYGAQSAQIMLDAIAASDGTREDIIAKMFETDVQEGLLGTFTFSEDGDPVGEGGATTAIVIYKATDKLETETTINPAQATVDAALGN
jgi:branched-chain amino acid transport system substrate-binding protein